MAGSRDGVRVWKACAMGEEAWLAGHVEPVMQFVWSRDGMRVASGSEDRSAIIWDVCGGTGRARLGGHDNFVYALAWSPDESQLATGTMFAVRVWDAYDGELLAIDRQTHDIICSLAWAPDGRRLASGAGDRCIRVWDILGDPHAKRVCVLRGHEQAVLGLAWSPGGGRLASWSHDGCVRVWDPKRQECLGVVCSSTSCFKVTLNWSSDGRSLTVGFAGDPVQVWHAPAAQLPEFDENTPLPSLVGPSAEAFHWGRVRSDHSVLLGADEQPIAWLPTYHGPDPRRSPWAPLGGGSSPPGLHSRTRTFARNAMGGQTAPVETPSCSTARISGTTHQPRHKRSPGARNPS